MSTLAGVFEGRAAADYVGNQQHLPARHFRDYGGAPVSSIGVGTYLGEADDATDERVIAALVQAVLGGLNMLDTASNYRAQRAERCVGRALARLAEQGVPRQAVLVATKGGFLTHDSQDGRPPRQYFEEELIGPGVLRPQDVAGGCHAMTPAFLRHQFAQSLKNLNLETIDLYYLHNTEMQREALGEAAYFEALEAAFVVLEEEVKAGRLGGYGLATWNGFRVARDEPNFHALGEVVAAARRAGGEKHHFRAIQLPFNLAMTEGLAHANHRLGEEDMTVFQAAARLRVNVFASAPLLQGRLAQGLPPVLRQKMPEQTTEAGVALQFCRSAPGVDTALVGLKQSGHVAQALAVALTPPLDGERFDNLFPR